MNNKQFNYLRWGSLTAVILISIIAWGEYYNWKIGNLTLYQIFPLFGLVAFLIMATHFILAGLRSKFTNVGFNKTYSKVSGAIVLACILLHPSLLVWQLWQNNYGLPPSSYYEFVGGQGTLFVTLGSTALTAFLVYEVLVRLKRHPKVVKYWFYILLSQLIALIFVFLHARNLGIIVNTGWFSILWILVSIGMLVGGVFALNEEWQKQKSSESEKT